METYQVTMTVDEPTREHLEQEAERRHRSMSYIARELVHESLPDDIEPAEVGP
jgi:predicted transcriptional regulator